MNTQIQESTPVLDIVKQVFAGLLVLSGLIGFYYFADSIDLLYRVLGLVALIIAAAGIVLTTQIGKEFWAFLVASRQEVRRVVWPSKDETIKTTFLVVVMVFMVGLFLWLVDMFLLWGVRFITGQGG